MFVRLPYDDLHGVATTEVSSRTIGSMNNDIGDIEALVATEMTELLLLLGAKL